LERYRVVLDEAHNIKNPRSRQAVAANALSATRRWAISGTPLQNRLADLHSLLAFVRLQPLDDRAFWMRVVVGLLHHSRGVSDWLHVRLELDLWVALTPGGCQISYTEHTCCHQLNVF
jgi:hypothetical protein